MKVELIGQDAIQSNLGKVLIALTLYYNVEGLAVAKYVLIVPELLQPH